MMLDITEGMNNALFWVLADKKNSRFGQLVVKHIKSKNIAGNRKRG